MNDVVLLFIMTVIDIVMITVLRHIRKEYPDPQD